MNEEDPRLFEDCFEDIVADTGVELLRCQGSLIMSWWSLMTGIETSSDRGA